MKRIRRNHRIVGAITLALVCVAFSAAPASAHLGRGFEQGAEVPVASRFVVIFTEFQDNFTAFMQRLGAIFAGQSGSQIVD